MSGRRLRPSGPTRLESSGVYPSGAGPVPGDACEPQRYARSRDSFEASPLVTQYETTFHL